MRARLLAEAFGGFAIVFFGAGAAARGDLPQPAVAAAFGLAVAGVILLCGRISGAHANPAVSIAFWLAGRLPGRQVAPYAAAQCAGALAAGFALRALLPESRTLGATFPAGSAAPSLVLEFALTLVLMLVILAVAHGAKERGGLAAAAVGATVALEAWLAGPVSGASMNPARSLGPAAAAGEWSSLWIYLLAPILGALTAVFVCRALRPRGTCCRGACA